MCERSWKGISQEPWDILQLSTHYQNRELGLTTSRIMPEVTPQQAGPKPSGSSSQCLSDWALPHFPVGAKTKGTQVVPFSPFLSARFSSINCIYNVVQSSPLFPKTFSSLQTGTLYPLSNSASSFPPPPLVTSNPVYFYEYTQIFPTRSITQFLSWRLVCFTQCHVHVFKVSAWTRQPNFTPTGSWGVSHQVDRAHPVSPFICQTLGPWPLSGQYECCWKEHCCTAGHAHRAIFNSLGYTPRARWELCLALWGKH